MLEEVSMDSLKNTRAFVGWWGTTETHLGTESANYENIDWSASDQVTRRIKFSGATLGFQQILTGEINFSLGARDGKLHVERKGPYQRIVQCSARAPVVLYDSCEQRAWLVPSSAVILHIAKTRHYRNPYVHNGKRITFPSADLSTSNHEAAEKVLLEQALFQLCTHGDIGNQGYYLRDLVRDIWSYLESLLDKNVEKEATSDPEVRGTARHILRGWEFMDLVDDRSPFRLKETHIGKSSGGWTDLSRDIDAVVLFGSGFEDIIKPTEESMAGLCHMWKSVPKGKDYLTASVPMMNQLYEQAGSKLSRKYITSTHLRWHYGGRLWEHCESTKPFTCNCNRLQQVVSDFATHFTGVSDPGPLKETGAVVFGQASDPLASAAVSELLKPKVKQGGTLYGQPNVDLLSMDTFSSPDSNLFSDTGTSILSVSVSTLPTSDEDDQDPNVKGSLEPLRSSIVDLVTNDQKREPSRSLKRSHTGEDTRPPYQPYRRQRKRCAEQIRELEVQYEIDHTPALLNTPGGASLAEKTTREDKKLSLRRKGNFTKQNGAGDGI
jgi:hypothetical protein